MQKSLIVKTSFIELAALVSGPDDAPPVLALHGWLDNAPAFSRLAPLLPELRLIAVDLPGHGHSDHRPAGIHYHFIDYVQDVLAVADSLGWQQFALLGHSLGAGIASFVAAVAPQRITRLALIEGLGPLNGDPADNPAASARAFGQMLGTSGKNRPVYDSLDQAIDARHRAGELSWQAAAILTERNTRPIEGGIGWRSDPRVRFKSPLYLSESQILAYLACIKSPTLLFRGQSGYLIDRANMTERYRQVDDLTVVDLPGSHHLHLEDPAPVAGVINQFLVRGVTG